MIEGGIHVTKSSRRRPSSLAKNPYGLLDGQIVTVNEVERGLACNCVCPACGHPLEAHKGKVRVSPYFSHYRGAECGAAYETALHLLAKDVLEKERRLLLPELKVTSDRSIVRVGTFAETETIVKPWYRMKFDEVFVEKSLGDIIPDVCLTKSGRNLFVEIRVTHKVDDAKLAKIRERNIATIEYDFSAASRILTREDIRRVLIETYVARGLGRGAWLYHPKQQETIDRLTAIYREKYLQPVANDQQRAPKRNERQKTLFDD